jgi:hypothetical protein
LAPVPSYTFPERRFVITRVDGGVESNVIVSTPLPNNFTTDSAVRPGVMDNLRAQLAANPGVHFRIYSPSSGGPHTDFDLVWDSLVSGPL